LGSTPALKLLQKMTSSSANAPVSAYLFCAIDHGVAEAFVASMEELVDQGLLVAFGGLVQAETANFFIVITEFRDTGSVRENGPAWSATEWDGRRGR